MKVTFLLTSVQIKLEARYGENISTDHNAIPWLIKHAGASITRYARGHDGRTAYERLKGKKLRRDVREFGENVWYLKPKPKGIEKIRCRWESGVW